MLKGGEDRVMKTFNINAECDRTNKIVTRQVCLTFKLLKKWEILILKRRLTGVKWQVSL